MYPEHRHKYIIEEAYSLFTRYGIRGMTMDAISQNLGISKKTLYKHIRNKEKLLNQVFAYIEMQVMGRIGQLEKEEMNAIDVLIKMSIIAVDHHKTINPVILSELTRFYPKTYADYLDNKKRLIVGFIKNNLEKGIKERLYRPDLNKELVALLYYQNIDELHKMVYQNNLPFEEIFEVMFENHIRAIANKKGIQYLEREKKGILNFQ